MRISLKLMTLVLILMSSCELYSQCKVSLTQNSDTVPVILGITDDWNKNEYQINQPEIIQDLLLTNSLNQSVIIVIDDVEYRFNCIDGLPIQVNFDTKSKEYTASPDYAKLYSYYNNLNLNLFSLKGFDFYYLKQKLSLPVLVDSLASLAKEIIGLSANDLHRELILEEINYYYALHFSNSIVYELQNSPSKDRVDYLIDLAFKLYERYPLDSKYSAYPSYEYKSYVDNYLVIKKWSKSEEISFKKILLREKIEFYKSYLPSEIQDYFILKALQVHLTQGDLAGINLADSMLMVGNFSKTYQILVMEVSSLNEELKMSSTDTFWRDEISLLPDFKSVKELNKLMPGKFLYLDFWASWCGPCLKSLDMSLGNFRELIEDYSNLELIFISVNDKDEKWKNLVNKYQLSGFHAIGDISFLESLAKMTEWAHDLPRYMLISPTGEIIDSNAPGISEIYDCRKLFDVSLEN